jgi:hypothetical protein
MTEWTQDALEAQGYYADPDPGSELKTDRHVEANAAHRESLLPCSRSAGQPLADKEPVTPVPEWARLCRDPAAWAQMTEARKALGL